MFLSDVIMNVLVSSYLWCEGMREYIFSAIFFFAPMMNWETGIIVFPLFIQGNPDNVTLMLLAVNILKQLI